MHRLTYIVSLIGVALALSALIVLQIHNAALYPHDRGFDAVAHEDYIKFIRQYHTLPLPKSGWEMHQPPLYYLLSSFFSPELHFNSVGYISWLLLGGSLTFFSWFVISKNQFFTHKEKVMLTMCIVSITVATPVTVYLSAAIGNEFFSTMMITLALTYYITIFLPHLQKRENPAPLIMGMLLGLALLSKTTSVVLIGAIVVERLLATKDKLKAVFLQLWKPLLLAGLIGGWFYIRNIVLYGNPLFQAADYIPLSSYAQPIVDRNFSFFFSPAAFFTEDFFIAQRTSFLAGTYFSWFYDGHGTMLPPQPYTKVGTILIVMSLPFFLVALTGFLAGFFQIIKNRNWSQKPYLLLYVYTVLLITGYVQYNFKLPILSTVKASFISSLLLPFAYFLYSGLQVILEKYREKNFKRILNGILPLYIFLYLLLITRHFWVQSWWYQ